MKKLAIFFLILIAIVAGISYLYLNYKANYYTVQRDNSLFESYEGKEVYGNDLATIVNKAVNNNKKYKVEKDKKGKYVDNGTNSIKIDIQMIDNQKTYGMETLHNGGMDQFVKFYHEIKFKCTKLAYHNATNRVSYLLFEQITE